MLKKALAIAKKAHADQVDKAGRAYIEHPIKVASLVKGKKAKIVALLHDVCEDSDFTLEDLRNEGFSKEIIEAIDAITKRENERYRHYIKRVRANKLATTVKIADATHNSDYGRITNYSTEDIARSARYKNTIIFLKMTDEEIEKYEQGKAPRV